MTVETQPAAMEAEVPVADYAVQPPAPVAARRARIDLFLISFAILFVELAAIRWFGSTVIFLTLFTNLVLMACFLGMSVGAFAARRKVDFIR